MIWKCTWLLLLPTIYPSLTSLRLITPQIFFVSAPFYQGAWVSFHVQALSETLFYQLPPGGLTLLSGELRMLVFHYRGLERKDKPYVS